MQESAAVDDANVMPMLLEAGLRSGALKGTKILQYLVLVFKKILFTQISLVLCIVDNQMKTITLADGTEIDQGWLSGLWGAAKGFIRNY